MLRILSSFSTYTLLVALFISGISAYYSIIGLTAIFSAAVTSIIIMGVALELGKLVAAVWLKLNWSRAGWLYKFYLVPAVAFLMALTSMGIFGFLSKAHSEQDLVGGDVQAQIALYDEKIRISKENIDANRRALKQMDEAVDQVMGRTTTQQGAERSVQIRRQQATERQRLLREIEVEQKKISALVEERAPIAAQVRKVEAEVGPIKYIAALIYGDNPEKNLLESAVRWVIIMIVIVFDPLALVLILAAQQSIRWEREDGVRNQPKYPQDDGPLTNEQWTQLFAGVNRQTESDTVSVTPPPSPSASSPTEYQDPPPPVQQPPEQSSRARKTVRKNQEQKDTTITSQPPLPESSEEPAIQTRDVTRQITLYEGDTRYVNYEGKLTSIEALKEFRPDLVLALANKRNAFGWSGNFPRESLVGDLHMRTDFKPHRLYKFNGVEWIPVDKNNNPSYLDNVQYVQFLIDGLNSFQYLPEMLTELEEDAIRAHLTSQ